VGINVSSEVLGTYADQGFSAEEPDDHILILNHEGALVGRFLQTGATKDSIWLQCEIHLATHQLSQNNSCR
jgi:hypothetical protein